MRFGTWKCLTRALPPSIAPNIASATCSVCVKWGALRWRAGTPWVLGNLRPDVSPWAASPWTSEAAKSDSLDAWGVTRVARKTPLALNSDSYNDKFFFGFFRYRLITQFWLMAPWESLPNHSKATMNLCRHSRYLRISHCRAVRLRILYILRYVPCVLLQISASSICFFASHGMINCRRFAVNYYAMGYTVQAWHAHGSQPDALAYWLFLAWNDHVWICGDVWYAYIHLVIRHVLIPFPVAAESPLVLKFASFFCFLIIRLNLDPRPTWDISLIWARNKNPAPSLANMLVGGSNINLSWEGIKKKTSGTLSGKYVHCGSNIELSQ